MRWLRCETRSRRDDCLIRSAAARDHTKVSIHARVNRGKYLSPEKTTKSGGRWRGISVGFFFDDNGRFLYEDLIHSHKFDDTAPFLMGEEREAFLDLVWVMLVRHQGCRKKNHAHS
ncbi:uncharacterized protein BP01DRAFT_27800 [Aspergillus saccharolyticus JOP 1030-1]|uniref:Uncharacterized protein n=1 Tax=Aspergillus saccharolyticus JOP 1030-1 TaxID=1450539 RepID=A0A318ZFT2_9EURO|nr:hypothetical protein BP01DRAFT_27800 [Aspergillus saccharolyticus JOP 1030-1]PYH46299.1 hypothetical protein BP01DRAFT_27800 [Aspergillus saccharolyticus JOP 1030-1]